MLLLILVSLACTLFAPAWTAAAAETVAIIYPRAAEPEQNVFMLMREGIRASVRNEGGTVVELELSEGETATRLAQRVRDSGATRLSPLGRRAYQLTAGLEKQYPMLTAGVNLPVGRPGRGAGISLFPKPSLVFETLIALRPQTKRVLIVIDPRRFGWIVKYAKDAARTAGLELVVYEAQDLGEAANHLWNIVSYGNARFDALWLLEADQFVTADVLPRLIEESWTRHFPVISNVLEHANRGALFATYIDPRNLGERVGREVLRAKRGENESVFLEDIEQALNGRVASHLDINVSPKIAQRFKRVLGEP